MKPSYPIDIETMSVGSEEAAPGTGYLHGIQTNLPSKDTVLGINFKLICPKRPFNIVATETQRIQNLTQGNYANFTQQVIDKFNLSITNPSSLESCRNAGDYIESAYYNDPQYGFLKPGDQEYDVL